MFLLVLAGVAFADPTTSITSTDTVVGTIAVRASADDVRRQLADPAWVTSVDGGGTSVTVVGREGSCLLADYVSPSMLGKITYTVRQCPTTDGVLARMTQSNTFKVYETQWTVVPDGAGTKLSYRLRMQADISFPQSWVMGTLKSSVHNMLKKLETKLGAR